MLYVHVLDILWQVYKSSLVFNPPMHSTVNTTIKLLSVYNDIMRKSCQWRFSKPVLSTHSTHVHIMAPISYSVCAISNM